MSPKKLERQRADKDLLDRMIAWLTEQYWATDNGTIGVVFDRRKGYTYAADKIDNQRHFPETTTAGLDRN